MGLSRRHAGRNRSGLIETVLVARVFARDDRRSLETVITFLEMTAPPRRPPRPAPLPKLAVQRAEKPPLSFYLWLYRTVGADWHWTDRLAMEPEELASTVHDPRVEIMVLYLAGVPVGFAELDFRARGSAELALFGLIPECLGRGLGSYLLDRALEALWRPGIARVKVDTNLRDHPRALAMYRKAGFRVVRRETSWLVPAEACAAWRLPAASEPGPRGAR